MIRRFQIEDLLAQDEHGVVFRAEDTETGRQVAVRRIFPFGVAGQGLNEEQKAAYEIAIQRFSKVHHAGLRSVVGGGCDPVDGMPFLATEWVDGPTLARALADRPVAAASVVALMDRVLEVSEALSETFAEDAVWVETSPSAIVISTEDAERGFTFWISPLRWLNETEGRNGLMSVVKLYKAATAHPDPRDDARVVTDLKRWATWLEKHAEKLTVQQARQGLRDRLMAESGITPAAPLAAPGPRHVNKAAPVVKPVGVGPKTSVTKPMPTSPGTAGKGKPLKKKPKSLMPLVTGLVVLSCLSVAGFQVWRYYQAKVAVPAQVAAEASTQSVFDLVNKSKDAPPSTPAASTPSTPSALATGVPGAQPVAQKPAPPKPAPAPKPAKKEAVAKAPKPPKKNAPVAPVVAAAAAQAPPAAAKGPVIPAAFIGTWNYTSEGQSYSRIFRPDGTCELMVGNTKGWTKPNPVVRATADTVVVKDPVGGELVHVLKKDGTLNVENKYVATKAK